MLPVLFDSGIKAEINELRKFRHRVHHGYSFTLDWTDLLIGANSVLDTFVSFSVGGQKYSPGKKTLGSKVFLS
jgi:hypothetical protein